MMEALFSVDALWFTAFSFYDATRAQWSVVAGWLLLNLVMHELGHAGASLAFGRPVEAVRLGARPVLLRIRSRRVGEWRIGLPLPNGATYYDDAVTLARWRAWLCTAAGPGANLALAAGAMFAHAFSPSILTFACFWIAFSAAIEGLVPLHGNADGTKLWRGALRGVGLACGWLMFRFRTTKL
ncbi:site-2 protease family protein [Cupriavidus sp. D39]|uniref:site-2 protease family protein n=1 Tax=Cupriavidus sp. D39 TaxID=2997877 RepID=UPI00226F127F|nr:site-2 protease family protein [Cupriavidus sp. D39]MCY0853095.1 site-2 protease family protein [Cupriavidus sp. D39]